MTTIMRSRSVSVQCTNCGDPRTVSYETGRKISKGLLGNVCGRCRTRKIVPKEFYLRWWLKQFGVDPHPLSVREYLEVNELPPELRELLRDIRICGW